MLDIERFQKTLFVMMIEISILSPEEVLAWPTGHDDDDEDVDDVQDDDGDDDDDEQSQFSHRKEFRHDRVVGDKGGEGGVVLQETLRIIRIIRNPELYQDY